jgi:mono/diheme cytochrome c family protein/uncharacterized membrane protein
MLVRRSSVPCLVFFAALLAAPIIIHLQAGRAISQQAASPSSLPEGELRATRELYAKDCAQCHDANGTGRASRKLFPETPDFTNAAWQAGRSDVQFLVSILEGKGTAMPGSGAKISQEQARSMVAFVRTFAPTKKTSNEIAAASDNSPASFAERLRLLQEQFAEQDKAFWELSKAPLKAPPDTLNPSPPLTKAKTSEPGGPAKSGPPGSPAVRELYSKQCANCHAANGTGSEEGRHLFPEMPDFTDASWQVRRSEGQFLGSILNGKGKGMPGYRAKISEEQARDLGAYVRAFHQTKNSSTEEKEGAPGEREHANSSVGFIEELVAWLGKSHRPAVHFPIALLVTAALAELLKIVTGRLSFDFASRYCIWVGAIMTVIAAVLGWFLGGFRLTDPSWILTTHRWSGVFTVACAGLVLGLSEVSRRRPTTRPRIWFRIALFGSVAVVMVTGFFGGAVAFGLDHYMWRP